MAKEAVNHGEQQVVLAESLFVNVRTTRPSAEEAPLQNGLQFERRLYHATFGLEDSKEGMDAFLQKRTAQWSDK